MEWAETNITLLIKERCTDVMLKAMSILDGLTSYNMKILGRPTWQNIPTKQIPILLLKLHLSDEFFELKEF
jgi:hypothetical protein